MSCGSLSGVSRTSRTEAVVDIPFLLRFRPLRVIPLAVRFDMMEVGRENTLGYVSEVVGLVYHCRDPPALVKGWAVPWPTSGYIAHAIGIWKGWDQCFRRGDSSKQSNGRCDHLEPLEYWLMLGFRCKRSRYDNVKYYTQAGTRQRISRVV